MGCSGVSLSNMERMNLDLGFNSATDTIQLCAVHDIDMRTLCLFATVWDKQRTWLADRRGTIRKFMCDGRTAKWSPPWLSLPQPIPGCLSGCLPLSLRQPLPLYLLLLHRDIKLIVDAWVVLVKNYLESKTDRTRGEKKPMTGSSLKPLCRSPVAYCCDSKIM